MNFFVLSACALAVEAPLNISKDGTIVYGLLDTGYTGHLVIPEGVKKIWTASFSGNNKLTSLVLPQSLEEIQEKAFSMCFRLSGSITVPDRVTVIGIDAFYNCVGLNGALSLGKRVTHIGNSAFQFCGGLTGSLTIPDSVIEIGEGAFFGCSSLNGTLTLGKSIKYIGSIAFFGCTGLTGTLTIPDSVLEIGDQAFYNCKGLTEVHVGKQITSIPSSTFSGCSLLKMCFFYNPEVVIGSSAFSECPGLEFFVEANKCEDFTIASSAFNGGPMSSNFVCLNSLPSTSLFTKIIVIDNTRLMTLLEAYFFMLG